MIVVRGANTVTVNSKEAILAAAKEMLQTALDLNNVAFDDIICIYFSCTRDLDAVYPAVAARKIGIADASLLCFQEMYVEGSLPMCVRLSMHVDREGLQKEVNHAYLGEAIKLRPDLMMKAMEKEELGGAN